MKRHEYASFARDRISEYQRAVRNAIDLLRTDYDCGTSILRAIGSGSVPSSGPLSDGTMFHRHGVGIRIERGDHCVVDFDFGPDDGLTGFDMWRLESFFDVRERRDSSSFASRLRTGFAVLEEDREIVNPRAAPASHLYYFSEEWSEYQPDRDGPAI